MRVDITISSTSSGAAFGSRLIEGVRLRCLANVGEEYLAPHTVQYTILYSYTILIYSFVFVSEKRGEGKHTRGSATRGAGSAAEDHSMPISKLIFAMYLKHEIREGTNRINLGPLFKAIPHPIWPTPLTTHQSPIASVRTRSSPTSTYRYPRPSPPRKRPSAQPQLPQ